MANELATTTQPQGLAVRNVDDLRVIAQIYEKASIIRQDQGNLAAADFAIKILAGMEMGVPAHASVTGIHVIKGKATLGANLIAALVKRSPVYDYEVLERSPTACRLAFFVKAVKRDGQWQRYELAFTLEEARKGQVQNLDKWPAAMLFARAITIAVRTYAPDLMSGIAAYVPEELGAPVDEDGEYIAPVAAQQPAPVAHEDGLFTVVPTPKPTPRPIAKADKIEDDQGPNIEAVKALRALQRALSNAGEPTPSSDLDFDAADTAVVMALGKKTKDRVAAFVQAAGLQMPTERSVTAIVARIQDAHADKTLLHGDASGATFTPADDDDMTF